MSKRWPLIAGGILLLVLVIGGVMIAAGDDDEASAQTVTFQKPTDRGPDPFTRSTDVEGSDVVDVGSGPFGGTGSDLVCDRELLIRSLRARPDRMRAWAEVLGIEPNIDAVARYIRKLKPVTLTRDTRVTNHSFEGGRAVAFQAILQAGTAVLVDKFGEPVVRCRCGNPLTKEIYYPKATCRYCPPDYEPPPPCDPYSECYKPYPHPPPVTPTTTTTGRQPGKQTGTTNPSASFSPGAGTVDDTYTLSVSGFSPNSRLTIRLTRPDGASESYSLTTDGGGAGSYTFPRVDNPQTGTYTAVVSGPGGSATASTTVSEASQPDSETPPDQHDSGDQTTTAPDQGTNTAPGDEQSDQPPSDYGY